MCAPRAREGRAPEPMALRTQDLAPATPALDRAPLLAGLDEGEREHLLARLERATFPAGARIDAGEDLYLLLEGTATVRHEQLALRRAVPGDHFGELAFLGHSHPGEVAGADAEMVRDIVKRSGDRLRTAGFNDVKFVVPAAP